jgi:hypothetical protein
MTAKNTKTRRVSGKVTARKAAAKGSPERPGESKSMATRRGADRAWPGYDADPPRE